MSVELQENTEKRQFTRVPFVSHIAMSNKHHQWQGTVVDISLDGILISFNESIDIGSDTVLSATLHFENDTQIQADITLAHHHDSFYGFHFHEIDCDSLSHLRQIISYHLGDAHACERELMHLFSYHQ